MVNVLVVAGVAGSKTTNHQSQYHRCHGEGNTIWSCSPICKRSVAQQNSYKGIHVRTHECFFGMPPIATISTIFLTRPNMSSIPYLSFNFNLLLVRASLQRCDLKGFGSEILGYALRWVSLMEWTQRSDMSH